MSSTPSQPSVRSTAERGKPPVSSPRGQQPGDPQQQEGPNPPEPEPEPEPPTPPCYVVTARHGGDKYERRPASTAGELRAEISNLVSQGTPEADVASGVFTAAGGEQARAVEGASRPLITIHGLPAAFMPILLGSPLDIDPAFVEAHAAGRRYRPMGVRRGRGARAARYAHWDYPELVAGYRQAAAQEIPCAGFKNSSAAAEIPGGVVDLGRRPVVRPVSDADKGLAAVFCRASLWVSRDMDVLFLDKPRWGEKGPLGKAYRAGHVPEYHASVSQEHGFRDDETKGDNVAVSQWKREGVPRFESILQDSLAATNKDSGVFQLLGETAYEQWLELFDILTPRRRVAKRERLPLELQIAQALERNLDMARSIARSQNGSGTEEGSAVGPDGWAGLMRRLRTRVEILAAVSPGATHRKPSGGKTAQEKIAHASGHRPEAGAPSSSQGSDDDNQRALDRVTYLGGILLPFSLVSGVLSMNDGFGPGQTLFWVFWVASIPLTLFTVLVVYADKLRQVEVWAEVFEPGGGVSDDGDKGSTGLGGGDQVQEAVEGQRKTTPGFNTSKYNMPQQPEAVTYSVGGDVVIDLGLPAAEIQQISARSPRSYGTCQRADSDEDQDQEATSSDEDTAEEVALPMSAREARHRPGWKKKQLGWKGAAMCMLRIRRPLRVLDGIPVAARQERRDD